MQPKSPLVKITPLTSSFNSPSIPMMSRFNSPQNPNYFLKDLKDQLNKKLDDISQFKAENANNRT